MTKTQRKDIERQAKAVIEKVGGVVKAAAKLGITTVTLNNLILGQRLYKKTEERLAKKFGITIKTDKSENAPEVTPKKAKTKRTAKPVRKAKVARKAAKKVTKTSKKTSKNRAEKHSASNGSTGPSVAADITPDVLEPEPAPAE